MSQPWLRVDLTPEPSITISPILNSDIQAKSCPSVITIIGRDLAWLECQPYEYTNAIGSAGLSVASFGSSYPVWINRLGNRKLSSKYSDNIDCLRLKINGKALATSLIPSISQILSDVVIFTAPCLAEAAEVFLEWIEKCSYIPLTQFDRPASIVIIEKVVDIDLNGQFMTACMKCLKANDLREEEIKSFFTSTNVFTQKQFNLEHIQDQIEISRRIRTAKKHLWTYKSFQKLHLYMIKAYLEGSLSLNNLVREFSDYDSLSRAQEILWPELVEKLSAPRESSDPVTSLIGLCIARRSLLSEHVFHPKEIYEALLSDFSYLSKIPDEELGPSLEGSIMNNMKKYCFDPGRSNDEHFIRLVEITAYWSKLKNFRICVGCIESACQIILPCGHSLCESCFRDFAGPRQVEHSIRAYCGTINCLYCPLCRQKFDSFAVNLPPPTARCQTLALDGGGTRGIVAIETLSQLQATVGLDIPIHYYFDLIVGTSTGGIIAIGLGLQKWNLDECRDKFISLAKTSFPKNEVWFGKHSGRPGLWQTIASLFNDCLYEDTGVEKALKSAFGDDELIYGNTKSLSEKQSQLIRVAVTTTESTSASIFTNYNKIMDDKETSYGWAQEDEKTPNLKIWEVARCTSAAPFYFLPKLLTTSKSKTYEDGGIFYNHPGPIAESESRKCFPQKPEPLLISIGCGIQQAFREPTNISWLSYRKSFLYRFYRSSMRNLEAHQQYEKYQLNRVTSRKLYHRLDPVIDMPETELDDVEAIHQIQSKVAGTLCSDVVFRSRIRDTAWLLASSLFYFEFTDCPVKDSTGWSCKGYINCRYFDNPTIMTRLRRVYSNKAIFQVQQKIFKFEVPCSIEFRLSKMDDLIHISLRRDDQIGPISGLPNTATNILAVQHKYIRGSLSSKRKRHLDCNFEICRQKLKRNYQQKSRTTKRRRLDSFVEKRNSWIREKVRSKRQEGYIN